MEKKFSTLNQAADAIINDLKKIRKPFVSPIVVFHNSKAAQWFKAYYLKNNPEVLMNVSFKTLSVFINDIVNYNNDKTIIAETELRDYIIKVLLENYSYDVANPSNPVNYIFNSDGSVRGINLYDFATKLAELYMNYEYDCENITDADKTWEKDIYKKAIELAEADNCYTTRALFDKIKENGELIKSEAKLTSPVYILDNSFVTNLYKGIIDELTGSEINIYSIEISEAENKCEKIFAAPSRLREVETVHAEICKIIRDNPSVRHSDILVYAPSINDYASTINWVFKQDDTHFPAIPYRIAGENSDCENMKNSLQTLFDIANKRFFTRYDINGFIKNPIIRYIWNIDDTMEDAWMQAILNTNTYQNGREDDWDYLKKRLLISTLVADDSSLENKTVLGTEDAYLPYAQMSLDFSSANKLIDLINALSDWCSSFTDELQSMSFNKDSLKQMREKLDTLYSKKNKDEEELNYYYRPVLEENEKLIQMDINIPANTWLLLLLQAPDRFRSNPADMFAGGVTFMSLNVDDILSEPYTFVMGLSSDSFPRVQVRSEIDYSEKHISSEKLDAESITKICAFAEHLTCNYVNRDLKKDSEHYSSSMMPGCNAVGIVIPLDESRDGYDELFTESEFANKKYYDSLTRRAATQAAYSNRVINNPAQNPVEKLKISDLKNFLENTFTYKFNKLTGKKDDDEENIRTEYRPLEESPLDRSNMIKDIVSKAMSADCKESCGLKRILPEGEIGEEKYEEIFAKAQKIYDCIFENGYTKKTLPDLQLNGWTIISNSDIYTREETDGNGRKTLYYLEPIEVKEKKNPKPKRYFKAYIFALMDIASKKDDETSYHVVLNEHLASSRQFDINNADAINILEEFYRLMTDYSDVRYMDYKFLEKNPDKLPETMAKFVDEISESNGQLNYFSDKKMIDLLKAFGYSEDDFKNEFETYQGEIKSLVKFLQ